MIFQIETIFSNLRRLIEQYEMQKIETREFLNESISFIDELSIVFEEKSDNLRSAWNSIEEIYAGSLCTEEHIKKYENFIKDEINIMKNQLIFLDSEMKNNMPQFESVFSARKKLVNIARSILDESYNKIQGCQLIYSLWNDAKLDKNDTYYLLTSLVSDSDDFSIVKSEDLYSDDYILDLNSKEKEFLSDNADFIKSICDDVIEKYSI